MIVTCASCQTRFRIADDKIGPRGAKVRCGRCKALFVVRRQEPAAVEPPTGPEPVAAPPPPAMPPPPPPEGTQGLDIELTSDPFALPRPRRDDPFARLAAPDPFAATPADPFAAASPSVDPFAAPGPDPFQAARLSAPASHLEPAAPAAEAPQAELPAPSGGIALEEAVRRSPPTPMPGFDAAFAPQTPAPGYESGFGLPADFRTPGPSGLDVASGEVPLPGAPAPEAEAPPRPAPAAPAPRAEAEEPAEPPPPLARRAVSALVDSASLLVLILLAAALFVYWKGGGTAAIWATLGRGGSGAPVAREVKSGLYDTRAGRPALFVRGEVVSAAGTSAPVKVRVELLDGGRRVAGGEGLAGALPSPEEIWGVDGAEAEARLRAALQARATRLEPERPAPFLVVLWEHPVDLRGLELQVVAEPVAGK